MVKAVLGEESNLNAVESQLSQLGLSVQVGLAVGKITSERAFVFGLIPTPPNDTGSPACSLVESVVDKKKNSKGKQKDAISSFSVDVDWVAEHARQVSKMLLGGMNVVGVYIWAAENTFKASTLQLLQTIKDVATASPFPEGCDSAERILVHISYSPRRWSCRSCIVGSSLASASFHPCDFRMAKIVSGLQTFKCTYKFEMRLPIFSKDAVKTSILKDTICNGIAHHVKELNEAQALVDGMLVNIEQPSSSDNVHDIELLCPFNSGALSEACSGSEIAALLVFCGTVYASTYLSSKEPISQAISGIKADIIESLRSRVYIISDEAEQMHGADAENMSDTSTEKPVHPLLSNELRFYFGTYPTRLLFLEYMFNLLFGMTWSIHTFLACKPFHLAFPRRVLIPWLEGVLVCDYLLPSETLEDIRERCKELLSINIEDEILEPETTATATTTKSFRDVVHGDSEQISDQFKEKPVFQSSQRSTPALSNLSTSHILTAALILLIAIIVGTSFMFLPRDHNNSQRT